MAGVAEPGQRREVQALVPEGFVGSNPTPRTISEAKDKPFLCSFG